MFFLSYVITTLKSILNQIRLNKAKFEKEIQSQGSILMAIFTVFKIIDEQVKKNELGRERRI